MCCVHRVAGFREQKSEELLDVHTNLPSAWKPFQSESLPPTEVDIGPHLIGTTIRYFGKDEDTDAIMECTIKDYGTSQLQRDWVDVVYGDARESRISREKMFVILASRAY